MKSDYLMEAGFPFGVMDALRTWIEVMVPQHRTVNVLNAIELYTIKGLILCYVNSISIKNNRK